MRTDSDTVPKSSTKRYLVKLKWSQKADGLGRVEDEVFRINCFEISILCDTIIMGLSGDDENTGRAEINLQGCRRRMEGLSSTLALPISV